MTSRTRRTRNEPQPGEVRTSDPSAGLGWSVRGRLTLGILGGLLCTGAAAAQTPPPPLPAPTTVSSPAPASGAQSQAAPAGSPGGSRQAGAAGTAKEGGQPAADPQALTPDQIQQFYRLDPKLNLNQVRKAWDKPVSAPGQVAPGEKVIDVGTGAGVERIETGLFQLTTIAVDPQCDAIKGIYLAGKEVWRLTHPDAYTVTLYPYQAIADGSLTLTLASGRTIPLYLRSEKLDYRQVPDLLVRLRTECAVKPGGAHSPAVMDGEADGATIQLNGREAAAGTGAVAKPDYLRKVPFDVTKLDYDQFAMMIGEPEDRQIMPLRVAHDGRHMFLDFGKNAVGLKLPSVFRRGDGIDVPVTTHIAGSEGQLLIVDGVGDITLRRGKLVVCITDRRELPSEPTPAPYGIERADGSAPAYEKDE